MRSGDESVICEVSRGEKLHFRGVFRIISLKIGISTKAPDYRIEKMTVEDLFGGREKDSLEAGPIPHIGGKSADRVCERQALSKCGC